MPELSVLPILIKLTQLQLYFPSNVAFGGLVFLVLEVSRLSFRCRIAFCFYSCFFRFKGFHRQLLCWPAPIELVLVSQISCPIRIQGESFPCVKDTAAPDQQLQDARDGLMGLPSSSFSAGTERWRQRKLSFLAIFKIHALYIYIT